MQKWLLLVAAKLWLDLSTWQSPDERGCCRMCVRILTGWKVTPTTLLAPSAQLTMHQKGIFRCFFIRCWGPTYWNGRFNKALYCCCTNVFIVCPAQKRLHMTDETYLELVHCCQSLVLACNNLINLKGPKHEKFSSRFIKPSKIIWVGDF
jgi:hypothetical protein